LGLKLQVYSSKLLSASEANKKIAMNKRTAGVEEIQRMTRQNVSDAISSVSDINKSLSVEVRMVT
jgi:hypothetical protein